MSKSEAREGEFYFFFTFSIKLKGTLGIVWLIVTVSLALADSTNDGDGELEYFMSDFSPYPNCEAVESLLTEENEAELTYCITTNNETVNSIYCSE